MHEHDWLVVDHRSASKESFCIVCIAADKSTRSLSTFHHLHKATVGGLMVWPVDRDRENSKANLRSFIRYLFGPNRYIWSLWYISWYRHIREKSVYRCHIRGSSTTGFKHLPQRLLQRRYNVWADGVEMLSCVFPIFANIRIFFILLLLGSLT